ncbi:MAG: transglutaminase domain-containing protein, partial [Pseudomonadota bacterium]
LYSPVIIENEFLYRVSSWPESRLEPSLSDWRREVETRLTLDQNAQTRTLARELYSNTTSTREYVNEVLSFFRENAFYYTLQPPLLATDNAMDDFLFRSRRGFCEHYAYAFTVMMRSVGIPARIVAGYHGGEVNPVNRTVIVHQFDAHAWTEVWVDGEGWIRVDPTSAVSPDRILYGLERAVAAEGSFLADSPLSPLRFRGVDWINGLRLRYDALTYRWQSWVTGFDGSAQLDLLRGVMGDISVRKSLIALLGTGMITMGLVSALLFFRRDPKRRHGFHAELHRFQQILYARGLARVAGEGPSALAERAQQRWPKQAGELAAINSQLQRLVYSEAAAALDQQRTIRSLRARIRRLRFSL